ncbi:MAG: site-specific DNA-methyltransferase [Thermoguttaceae bacterium]|nr:site-specific DNA-methyltransferase [Thermoguttaceae bacterium]
MDKMKMETPNLTAGNIEKIEALFPSCITESKDANGQLKKAVNFELLRQMLSGDVIEGNEAYEFTWVGKKAAIVGANRPIRKTLRPCPEESADWDTTGNLYIEGDNLKVLKLLQESYLGKIKMIYIDPPYNTGNDFIYLDDFTMAVKEYEEAVGAVDKETGNRLVKNTDTNGRFHSDWCSMIYARLLLARNLLKDDGVIFISIDDNEQENLKKICDEVFGGQNFVAQLIWERAYSPKNDAKYISNSHDYVLFYAKNIDSFQIGRLPRTEEANARYSNPDNDPRGVWKPSDLSVKTYNADCDYPITTPSGRIVEPPAGRCWRLSKKAFLERLQDNRIWFGPDGNNTPSMKRFLTELKIEGMAPTSILFYKEVGHSQEGAQEVSKLLEGGFFNGPKPQRLMNRLLTLANLANDDIVLDFFSGSGSLGHAVMQMNAEHIINGSSADVKLGNGGGKQSMSCGIKYIMVQLPESCDEKSEAYKAGYRNICEIGKERIRRAGKQIKEKDPLLLGNLDVGFRVLKLDETNMNDVYYAPGDYSRELLEQAEDNIKDDRTDLDLLFGCLLDWGVTLSDPYESIQIEGHTVHNYNGGDLIACFDKNVPESVIKEIAKLKPVRAVFRESCFKDSAAKINVEQIFKMLSPDTEIRVI